MKSSFILMALLWAFMAGAQTTNTTPSQHQKSVQTQILASLHEDLLPQQPSRPNEIKLGKLSLSGIAVEVVKTRNPLQLINPAPPPEYGAEDNLARDPISGRPCGLKLFSLRF